MQKHRIPVPDLGRITKQEGFTVWLKEKLTLPNGILIEHAPLNGHTAFQYNINGLLFQIPVGYLQLNIQLDDGETLIEVPNHMISHITANKDFPSILRPL